MAPWIATTVDRVADFDTPPKLATSISGKCTVFCLLLLETQLVVFYYSNNYWD